MEQIEIIQLSVSEQIFLLYGMEWQFFPLEWEGVGIISVDNLMTSKVGI